MCDLLGCFFYPLTAITVICLHSLHSLTTVYDRFLGIKSCIVADLYVGLLCPLFGLIQRWQ